MLPRRLPRLPLPLTRGLSTAAPPPPPPSSSKMHHVRTLPSSAFPHAFSASSTHAGIKKHAGSLDLGLLVSTHPGPCSAAASFTRNVFKAAPVVVSSSVLASSAGHARAVIINSGCANAVTGAQGLADAQAMSDAVESVLPPQPGPSGTLVLSTGVIGQALPIQNILSSVPSLTSTLASTPAAWLALAKAFMTTDTFPKLRAREVTLPSGRTIRIAGIDKGAGMIHPNMGPPAAPHATLLGVLATDAPVAPERLQEALNWAVDRSFNAISVDGDMSTNDTVLALANGAEGGKPLEGEDYEAFREELTKFAVELAQLVVRDGEGATKFVTVTVENAPSFPIAQTVARTIATSSLVKTALYGQDANWGRILCAVGYAPLAPPNPINPTAVSVSFRPSDGSPDLALLVNGEPEQVDEERASAILAHEDLEIRVDLGVKGGEEARYWTCDFSHEYVTINGSYRS